VTGPFPMPTNLVESAARDLHERRRDWLARLPGIVSDLAARWELRLGEPYQPGGESSWVAPVRTADGGDLTLKVGWRHPESDHEGDGLRVWAGRGTVLLHAEEVVDDTHALLVEQCRDELLRGRPEEEQDEVVAGLLRRLWVEPPAGPPFRPLTGMCAQWADQHEIDDRVSLDPGIARAGVELWRSLPRTADRHVLLATDLHAGNVLAADREPWLVIDPKPYVGDPAYDPLQHLLNCPERLHADPLGLADRMADLTGVDRDRLRLWLFARCAVMSPSWPSLAPLAVSLAHLV
jgi:streptomycin 6-kinase